jgi:5-methylcytosine-specific restriction endonuclease McrA
MPGASHDAIAFGERILSLLEQGRFTATYKYALLLALIDVCLEQSSEEGEPPRRIPIEAIAAKIIELYWPHTVPFAPVGGQGEARVLRQNITGQAEIVSAIARFRRKSVGHKVAATVAEARAADPSGFERLIRHVEWKLAEMPLPRLQLVANTRMSFLYDIGWEESIRSRDFRDPSFDRSIRLQAGAGKHLVELAGLLRPLIQREWAAWIARQRDNRELIEESYLDEFLFGAERVSLDRVRPGLSELQAGRCFYCQRTLRSSQVDHFIPWSRYADDGIDNLVLACSACNNSKRNYLAAGTHVARWSERFRPSSPTSETLAAIAHDAVWARHPERTLSVARAIYLRLPGDVLLWSAPTVSVPAVEELVSVRNALAGN